MVMDPYSVLGVSQGATQEEIKKAYRQKAKLYHPDLHPGDAAAAQKMNELNEAYAMLTNPEKYSRQQSQSSAGSSGSSYGSAGYQTQWSGDFSGFEDIFRQFYGGGRTYSGYGPQAEPGDSDAIRAAIAAIQQGSYGQAASILAQVPIASRNARWYYLSALCYRGMGNNDQASEYIRRAMAMDPGNSLYQALYQQYSQTTYAYRSPLAGLRKIVVFILASQLILSVLRLLLYSLRLA